MPPKARHKKVHDNNRNAAVVGKEEEKKRKKTPPQSTVSVEPAVTNLVPTAGSIKPLGCLECFDEIDSDTNVAVRRCSECGCRICHLVGIRNTERGDDPGRDAAGAAPPPFSAPLFQCERCGMLKVHLACLTRACLGGKMTCPCGSVVQVVAAADEDDGESSAVSSSPTAPVNDGDEAAGGGDNGTTALAADAVPSEGIIPPSDTAPPTPPAEQLAPVPPPPVPPPPPAVTANPLDLRAKADRMKQALAALSQRTNDIGALSTVINTDPRAPPVTLSVDLVGFCTKIIQEGGQLGVTGTTPPPVLQAQDDTLQQFSLRPVANAAKRSLGCQWKAHHAVYHAPQQSLDPADAKGQPRPGKKGVTFTETLGPEWVRVLERHQQFDFTIGARRKRKRTPEEEDTTAAAVDEDAARNEEKEQHVKSDRSFWTSEGRKRKRLGQFLQGGKSGGSTATKARVLAISRQAAVKKAAKKEPKAAAVSRAQGEGSRSLRKKKAVSHDEGDASSSSSSAASSGTGSSSVGGSSAQRDDSVDGKATKEETAARTTHKMKSFLSERQQRIQRNQARLAELQLKKV